MFDGKTWRTVHGVVAGLLLIASAAVMAPSLVAQDDDSNAYQAYFYPGTVAEIETATEIGHIGDLEAEVDLNEDQALWARISMGQDMPDELCCEDEDLLSDISFDVLFTHPNLIVVHASDDRESPIVAVGQIEGTVDGMGGVLIQLDEYDGSGLEGRAWMGPETTNDDNQYEVEIVVAIYPAGDVEPLETPAATPST